MSATELESFTLFPSDFYHFKKQEIAGLKEKNGEPVTNEISDFQIEQWIWKVKQELVNGREHSSIGTGNTRVVGLKYNSEIQIMVMKNYYHKRYSI